MREPNLYSATDHYRAVSEGGLDNTKQFLINHDQRGMAPFISVLSQFYLRRSSFYLSLISV
jgi:hypothetical protein